MKQTESTTPKHDSPFASPHSEPTAGSQQSNGTPHKKWSRGWIVLFGIAGLASLIPPMTGVSTVCMVLGSLFLVVAERTKRSDPNVDRTNRTIAIALFLFPGLLLTSFVMFAGTCNSIVWPVILFKAYPAIHRPDLLRHLPASHLVVGMLGGAIMATIWCVWLLKGNRQINGSATKPK